MSLLLPDQTVSDLGWVTWVQHSTVTGKGSASTWGQALLLALPLVFYCSFVIHIKPSNMLVYSITFYSTKAVRT